MTTKTLERCIVLTNILALVLKRFGNESGLTGFSDRTHGVFFYASIDSEKKGFFELTITNEGNFCNKRELVKLFATVSRQIIKSASFVSERKNAFNDTMMTYIIELA